MVGLRGNNGSGVFRVSMCGGTVAEEMEQLSREGSHYSTMSSGILPSLGARSNRRVKLRKFIVSPYDRRYRLVDSFVRLFVGPCVLFLL